MNDSTVLIFLLLIAAIVFWFLILEPKLRAERERRAAELTKLRAEREAILKEMRGRAPNFILKARLEFEREYRANKTEAFYGQAKSPLKCFGYSVGKSSIWTESERHAILEYGIVADLHAALPFLEKAYRDRWGPPLSIERFNVIYDHLNGLADIRSNQPNLQVAISHWLADAAWFHSHQRAMVEKYRQL